MKDQDKKAESSELEKSKTHIIVEIIEYMTNSVVIKTTVTYNFRWVHWAHNNFLPSIVMSQLVENISDTPRWVAIFRAEESERPDAVLHDHFARI